MSKVKITQEQADALEAVRDREKVRSMIIRWHTGRGRWVGDEESLNELELDDLIRALYIGYEVEPEFEVGDWGFTIRECGQKGQVGQVVEVYKVFARLDYGDGTGSWWSFRDLRHATPEEIAEEKERRWWAKHDRDVWGIREDDVLEYLGDLYIIDCFDSEEVCLKSGIERKTNYAEPFDFVKKHFKVVCFAEDRKDV